MFREKIIISIMNHLTDLLSHLNNNLNAQQQHILNDVESYDFWGMPGSEQFDLKTLKGASRAASLLMLMLCEVPNGAVSYTTTEPIEKYVKSDDKFIIPLDSNHYCDICGGFRFLGILPEEISEVKIIYNYKEETYEKIVDMNNLKNFIPIYEKKYWFIYPDSSININISLTIREKFTHFDERAAIQFSRIELKYEIYTKMFRSMTVV